MGGRSMILYHGGTEAVMQPDCKAGRPDLDFGQGFYVTLLQGQAEGFARRKARDRRSKPVISVYEFDYDAAILDCAYLKFEFYDEAWLDFVVASRNGSKPWATYDIVEGGVANDRVIDTVELYTIGILDKASALGRLSEHQPNHQICILNQGILDKYLKFVNVIEL
ncbi:MAG: DUF3990 domain-containing protein [Paludibacteraceae bacterium]|nr:DUF3990 domain-containing protein [Paludibacteraceae bacterium]